MGKKYISSKKRIRDEYAGYQKEGSIHESMKREGFRNVTAIKRRDKAGLLKLLNSYSRGYHKIAILDGSEIGAEPVYLPKPLSSHYVVYIKDTRKQGRKALEELFEPKKLLEEGESPNIHTRLYNSVRNYAARKQSGGQIGYSTQVKPTNQDALELYKAIKSGSLKIHNIGSKSTKLLKTYLSEAGLVEE